MLTDWLHCLASAEGYSYVTSDDMDIEVEGCLFYETDSDGGSIAYDNGVDVGESIWGISEVGVLIDT